MDTLHTINGKPIGNPTVTAAPPALAIPNPTVTAAADVHRAESGKVGETGLHGKLGTNAK